MNPFKFKPLRHVDLTLMHQWFQEPTINYWYAKNKNWSLDEIKEKYEPRILGNEQVPGFVVYQDNTPLGFIQYYVLTDSLPDGIDDHHPLFKKYPPNELAGIDLFIALDTVRGRGLGVLLINQFISKFLTHFKAVIIDPNINNLQAIRCYEKAGFKKTTFSQNSNHLIMIKSLASALEYARDN
ncbi:GNAT family N-acetyltransferase [Legionella israelensis]|uniref:GNAT family N-acetyltransferase n=2 Tax=Legionella israelensis TaxID=454 RepID=A0AAX1EIB2_9GAMM|nr:GNAT family N-acetyltransferase [Legionella israelensis]QBR84772.1 GNAT family N-acetyltransferase [Legionella israelensis]